MATYCSNCGADIDWETCICFDVYHQDMEDYYLEEQQYEYEKYIRHREILFRKFN